MSFYHLTAFSPSNRRMILLLVCSLLLWCTAVFGLWMSGSLLELAQPWWPGVFLAVQLFGAVQLLLPVLRMEPEQRSRLFYLFWGAVLALCVWLLNQPNPGGLWEPILTVLKSGLLMLAATAVGAVLARYIRRLWEIVPICLAMALADFVSWFSGPTAGFTRAIEQYYRAPEGPPPLIDMVLVKLAFPDPVGLAPVFGISDWIMVVFFAAVASRHGVNDNLLGSSGQALAQQGRSGGYLPVSAAALLVAVLLAQGTGLFLPALPIIALIVLLWYAGRYLLMRRKSPTQETGR